MIQKGLSIGIILLFLGSSIVTMMVPAERQDTRNRSPYDCYHLSDAIPSPSSVYGEDKTYKTFVAGSSSQTSDDGLMNSSWPMYCHDVRHTGQSPYSTVNTTGVEKWRMSLGTWVQGGPVIDKNGVIYIGGNGFFAIYPNGTIKWRYPVEAEIDSTAAIDKNGIIYIGTIWDYPNNYLYALYPNGTLKWRYPTSSLGDIHSSPAIGYDGTIYFGDEDAYINALYPNGTLRWRYHTTGAVLSSPAIGNDGTIYCGSHDQGLYALYPNNGTVKWRFGTGGWVRTAPCIADDGTIYCVSLSNYLFAINPNGTMKWRTDVGAGTSPTIGQDGTIYAGWDRLYAINPTNGSVKWAFNPGSYHCIEGGTPAHSADGTIYCGAIIQIGGSSTGGEIIAVNSNGTEKWRKTIADFQVRSPPAIAEDGTVYIGSCSDLGDNSYFHAFGPGEPKQIKIQEPKTGHLYFFGQDKGTTLRGKTIIIGSVTIKVDVSSIQDIASVDFCIGHWEAWNPSIELKYTDTEPPFEWTLNEYMGNKYRPIFPFDYFIIQVVAHYKGGCVWIDEIPKCWYFHLLKI